MQVFPFADAQLEVRIDMIRRELETAQADERRKELARTLRELVLKRSAAQVKKMEEARGLA